MKKRILLLLICTLTVCLLTACGCEHTWTDATCLAPRTCTQCKKTEGELAAHVWADATCLTPKTCTVCAATEGELANHVWEEATCQAPKTCSVCSATEGSVGDHDLIPEYLNEHKLSGTCTVCGEKVTQHTNYKEKVAMQILAGKWTAVELRNHGSGNNEDAREYNLVFEFREDGYAYSAIPGCAGDATVVYDSSNESFMKYEMTVNGEVSDIWLMPDTPNQITVWIPGYYSTFLCEKN